MYKVKRNVHSQSIHKLGASMTGIANVGPNMMRYCWRPRTKDMKTLGHLSTGYFSCGSEVFQQEL